MHGGTDIKSLVTLGKSLLKIAYLTAYMLRRSDFFVCLSTLHSPPSIMTEYSLKQG